MLNHPRYEPYCQELKETEDGLPYLVSWTRDREVCVVDLGNGIRASGWTEREAVKKALDQVYAPSPSKPLLGSRFTATNRFP